MLRPSRAGSLTGIARPTPSTDCPIRVNITASHETEARRQSSRGALGEARRAGKNRIHVDRAFGGCRHHRHSGGFVASRVKPGEHSQCLWSPQLGKATFENMSANRKILAVVSLAVMLAFLTSAQDWTMASASSSNYWISLASTADGGRLFAGTPFAGSGPSIFTSTNFGSTWTLTGAPPAYWGSVACSADGSVITASGYAHNNGILYVSTNFGTGWTPVFSPSNQWWGSVACSADGKTMAAVGGVGGTSAVYISTDYGAEWTPTGATNGGWLAMSADGSRLAITTRFSVDVSTNFGLTWTATYPPAKRWAIPTLRS